MNLPLYDPKAIPYKDEHKAPRNVKATKFWDVNPASPVELEARKPNITVPKSPKLVIAGDKRPMR
jgi:hypothetical protein